MLTDWLLTGLVVAFAGAAIGATSIGGVLVVPALTALLELPLPTAVAASSFGFLITGLYALTGVGQDWRQQLRHYAPLLLAALMGAVLGAWLTARIPGEWIKAWIGVLALGSGLFALWRTRIGLGATMERSWPAGATLGMIGAVVGIGSALSGTGGPVMLLPLLLLMRLPLPQSVAVAQLIQVPVAVAASAAHAVAGRLDWWLGSALGLVLLGGAWVGRRIARGIGVSRLQVATALVLLATGLCYAAF